MSGLRDIVKGGWHPEKDVPIKDSLKGLVGKGKKKDEEPYRQPVPITSLRDPASFPPPPKHIATGATPSPPPGQPYRPPAAGAAQQSYSSTHTTHNQTAEEAPPAPRPYRVDTTGLSTSHLPPPPRRTGAGAASTPSPPPVYGAHAKPPPPSLPPRLPPRTSTPTSTAQPTPPPSTRPSHPEPKQPQQSYLNQSAITNLSSRGISVPGFNIGSSPTPSTQPSPAPATGTSTSWSQKRAALQTASSAYKDPSSVSARDAVSAASTINNFHQRHGEQIGSAAAAAAAGKKKPPPPPPGKKPALAGVAAAGAHGTGRHGDDSDGAPPPVPLGTRPQF